MKILLINGSPKGKNSNTLKLSNAFVQGMAESVKAEISELDLTKLEVNHCLGCFSCWSKTPGECVIKDSMREIGEKMLWADVLIWSFPLYYFNVPSKLKALIDRQLPAVLPFMVKCSASGSHPTRYDIGGKKHVLISTCGFYTAQGNYDSVLSMFDHFLGINSYETLFCGQGELFRVEELKKRTDEYLDNIKTAGREYANGEIGGKTRKKLEELLYPREVFEAMADSSWGLDETGERVEEYLSFTRQMAALYNKSSYKRDLVLEMNYTDVKKSCQIIMTADRAEVITENFLPYTTKISTPLTLWQDIARGRISGAKAMMKKMYRVEGKVGLVMQWNKYFG